MSVDSEIAVLSERRAAIWAGSPSVIGEMARVERKLADLYEKRRHDQAQETAGAGRKEIQRRARVESELERLMTNRRG